MIYPDDTGKVWAAFETYPVNQQATQWVPKDVAANLCTELRATYPRRRFIVMHLETSEPTVDLPSTLRYPLLNLKEPGVPVVYVREEGVTYPAMF